MPKLSKETRSIYSDDTGQWQSTDSRSSNQPQIKAQLEHYLKADLSGDEDWTKASEIPTEREIGCIENGEVIDKFKLDVAKIDKPYESKEEYLATQYKLMRADGTIPLANCVRLFRRDSNLRGDTNDYRVYDDVCISKLSSHV